MIDKKVPLGAGDVESFILGGKSRARQVFIDTVRRLYPKVFRDIKERTTTEAPTDVMFWNAWKREHRLQDAWLTSSISYQVLIDVNYPAVSEMDRCGDIPHITSTNPELDGERPEDGGLMPVASPMQKTRAEYLEMAGKHYNARASHLLKVGHPKVRRRAMIHFEWLAHHTAGGLSFAEVWRKFPTGKSRDAVLKGTRSLAAFINLTLPPSDNSSEVRTATQKVRLQPTFRRK